MGEPKINPQLISATPSIEDPVSLKGVPEAPNPKLGNVTKPSAWALAGRIVLGICTLCFSELIRAIVNAITAKPVAKPKLNSLASETNKTQAQRNYNEVKSTLVGLKKEGAQKTNVLCILQSAIDENTISIEQAAQLEKELYPTHESIRSERVNKVLEQLQMTGLNDKHEVASALVVMVNNNEISKAEAEQIIQKHFEGTRTTHGNQSLNLLEQNTIRILQNQNITSESVARNALDYMVKFDGLSQESANRILQYLFPSKATSAKEQPLSETERLTRELPQEKSSNSVTEASKETTQTTQTKQKNSTTSSITQKSGNDTNKKTDSVLKQNANSIPNRLSPQVTDKQVLQFTKKYIDLINGEKKTEFANEKIRKRLIQKLSYGENKKVHSFAKDFYKDYGNASEEKRLDHLRKEYEELLSFQRQATVFERSSKLAKTNLEKLIPDTKSWLAEDFLLLVNDEKTFKIFMSDELKKDNSLLDDEIVSRYHEKCLTDAKNEINSIYTTSAVAAPSQPIKASQDPGLDSIKAGTVFRQHANTCFMMAPINSLCSTQQGALYVEQWMKNFATVPTNSKLHFSDYEQRLGHFYSGKDENWAGLGDIGESLHTMDFLGLDHIGTQFPSENSTPLKLRKYWVETTLNLKDGKGAILFTANPDHYRAIVGTYGNASDDTTKFGYIVRDSISQTDSEESAEAISKSARSMIYLFSRSSDNPPMPDSFDN